MQIQEINIAFSPRISPPLILVSPCRINNQPLTTVVQILVVIFRLSLFATLKAKKGFNEIAREKSRISKDLF